MYPDPGIVFFLIGSNQKKNKSSFWIVTCIVVVREDDEGERGGVGVASSFVCRKIQDPSPSRDALLVYGLLASYKVQSGMAKEYVSYERLIHVTATVPPDRFLV